MVSQSRFTVHGQVHVIGTNLVSSEIGMGESGRFTMPTPALSSILPSPCFSGVLAEEVEEETWPEEGSTEIIAGVELERNSQHGLPLPALTLPLFINSHSWLYLCICQPLFSYLKTPSVTRWKGKAECSWPAPYPGPSRMWPGVVSLLDFCPVVLSLALACHKSS